MLKAAGWEDPRGKLSIGKTWPVRGQRRPWNAGERCLVSLEVGPFRR